MIKYFLYDVFLIFSWTKINIRIKSIRKSELLINSNNIGLDEEDSYLVSRFIIMPHINSMNGLDRLNNK